MGLDQFNVAPDNKGGRKEKEEEGTFTRSSFGTPFVQSEDSEEWWIEAINSAMGKTSIDGESIEEMEEQISTLSNETHLTAITVWKKLDEHGIIEMDWEEYREYYPDHLIDARVPGGKSVTGTKSSSRFYGSSDDDSSLRSFVNDAK